MESSIAVTAGATTVLVDVTRDFSRQVRPLRQIDLVLLTHAHRDATGGIPALARWLAARERRAAMWSAAATLRALEARHRRLAPLERVPFRGARAWHGLAIAGCVVPHAADTTTLAWRIAYGGRTLVYASDVARLERPLRALSRGCDLLILDGATWRRRIFTHLELRSAALEVARWPVRRVLFTQLGRSTPPHEQLEAWLRAVDPRLGAAHDGLELDV